MDGLPTKTGNFLTLPDGMQVFVRVLNALQRDEARDAADITAATAVRKYRKGGDAFESLAAEIAEMTTDRQAAFLAETAFLFGEIGEDVEAKHPLPERPTRGELTEDGFLAALETWEADTVKVTEKRVAYTKKLFDEKQKHAEGLTAKVRQERCLESVRRRKYADAMNTWFPLEILLRATRKADNVNEKHFRHIQEVVDLDDDSRDALQTFYFQLIDPVKPAEIPTSPAS